MVYGIVSQLDDVTTLEFFRSKKVSKENVVHISQISTLANVLNFGDVVFVVSVNRFLSVSQFLNFGKLCMNKGICLRLLAQPYLDITNGKQWKNSVIRQMTHMVNVERRAIGRMAQGAKYTNEFWEYLCRSFEIMNLEVLAQIYATDGIMKRGS